jgi:hypothetical protein
MDIDINYQKIIKKLKIRLFKTERYFESFKTLLLSLDLSESNLSEKTKVYNLIKSKYSIQKKHSNNFWYTIFISFQKPSTFISDNMSLLEEKYLQYYSLYILRYLNSMSLLYSAPIIVLKQEYLNLCIKFINHSKNKKMKTLRFLTKNSLKQSLHETKKKKAKDENSNIDNKDKSSEEDDDDNKRNSLKKYFDLKRPKTLLEKELYKLKLKSSNEVVDEFIGDINNELLMNKKKEICFLHFIKTKKNKIFRRFLSKETRKNINTLNENEIMYNNNIDKYKTIFSLEMKIKNESYRKNKNKRNKLNLKMALNNNNNIYNNTINIKNNNYMLSENNEIAKNNEPLKRKKITMNISKSENRFRKPNKKISKNCLSKCLSFNKKKVFKNNRLLYLPLLSKYENDIINTVNDNEFINKKYYINRNDLFY